MQVLAVVVLSAVAHCQEHLHSYKVQTIVKHEEPKKIEHHSVQIPIHSYHSAPSHEYYSGGQSQEYSHDQSHGHAVSSQSIIRHDSGHHEQSQGDSEAHHYIVPVHHEPAPVHEIVSIKAAPRIEIQSGGQSHGHGHAVSSQSIIRHDSGHHEQSNGDSHYVVAAPIHQTVSLHSAPIHEIHSGGQSHGHAVSSQSIIRHDSGHKEESQNLGSHYFVPVEQHSAPIHTISLHATPSHEIRSEPQSHGHAISSQNIIRHDSHQSNEGSEHYVIPVHHHAAPIRHTVIEAAPIHQYVQQSGHQQQSHDDESHHVDYYVSLSTLDLAC